jgi:hypothetical protein
MKRYIAALPAAFLIVLPIAANAHEHQSFEINGITYEFTIGSLNEPVTVDDKTGVDLRIAKSDTAHAGADHDGIPVVGLEETLKVEMIAGDKKKVTDLTPVFNTPGAYKNSFYPTVATTLSYRVFGTLEGTPIDLTFTCNPAGHAPADEDTNRVQIGDKVFRTLKSGSFGCPTPKADLGFPEPSAEVVSLKESDSGDMIGWGAGVLALAALAVAFTRRRA